MKFAKTCVLLSALLLVSCVDGPTTSTSSSTTSSSSEPASVPSSDTTPDSSSDPVSSSDPATSSSEDVVPFETALAGLQSKNIAFTSRVYSNYTPLTSGNQAVKQFDGVREASYVEGKYRLVASDGASILADNTYFKDSNGFAAMQYINLQNQVLEFPLTTGNGQAFLWDSSVYLNLFGDLTKDHFKKIDDKKYSLDLTVPNFESWGEYIAMSLTGFSSFDAESVIIHLNKDGVHYIDFTEKPMLQSGYPYAYSRSIVATVDAIGGVDIPTLEPYASDPNNDQLGTAIAEMKAATSYTTTITAYPFNGTGFETTPSYTEVTAITAADIVSTKTDAATSEVTYSGYHTTDTGIGVFSGTSDPELGPVLTEASSYNGTIDDIWPDFDFSEDIFEYHAGEDDSTAIYTLRDSGLASVLGQLAFSEYLDTYYNIVPIQLVVKNGHLHSLTFDGAGLEAFYMYELTYSAINQTTIPTDFFANYTAQPPVTSYDDERLCFEFWDDLEGPFDGLIMGFGEFFEIAGITDVPFYTSFNPAMDEYMGGLHVMEDGSNIVDIAMILDDSSGLGEFIGALYEAGFDDSGVDETGMYAMLFTKGDLKIGITEPETEEDPVQMCFIVPDTNFLAENQ